jgi:hypothetical protein
VRIISVHNHPVGPDDSSKRKRHFCDECGRKGAKGYRCVSGCDYDICPGCFDASEPRELDRQELTSLWGSSICVVAVNSTVDTVSPTSAAVPTLY